MRSVKRDLVKIPTTLVGPESLGAKETEEAIAFFSVPNTAPVNPAKKTKVSQFKFKAYSGDSVRMALEDLFHGKCAYCESRYAAVHPVDVEHWRPKSEVVVSGPTDTKVVKERGYYWLAATWSNLLPSCIDCNRIRNHTDLFTGKPLLLGKGNWFPLVADTPRSRRHDDKIIEEPLLVNPCDDEAEEFFDYDDKGIMHPRGEKNSLKFQRAEASLRFYALNRPALVEERKLRINQLRSHMITIRTVAKILERGGNNPESELAMEDLLSYQFVALEKMAKASEPFSVLTHRLIERFRKNLDLVP